LLEVQSEACRTVEVLASHGIDALLMTRGYIRPSALQVLARHRERLRITIPLTTMDRGLAFAGAILRISSPARASNR